MSRRLLGPVGGPIVFFLVAALVFAGLGWVTHSALRVELAQREAAAQAELGNNLRVALWRLDGRMLPALGVEDGRPFYHYAPADPIFGYGAAATPLLAASLPDWMKLHFQLDPATGWESPQVLTAEAVERIRQEWPELPLRNVNQNREVVLADLRAKYPARDTLDVFCTRDRAIPADSLSLVAPLFVEGGGSQQTDPGPNPAPRPPAELAPKLTPPPTVEPVPGIQTGVSAPARDVIRIFGLELCTRPEPQSVPNDPLGNSYRPDLQNVQNTLKKAGDVSQPPAVPRSPPSSPGGVSMRNGRGATKDVENDRSWLDFLNRAQTVHNGMRDAKQPYEYPLPKGSQGQYGQNTVQGMNNDLRSTGNQIPLMPGVGNKTAGNSGVVMNSAATTPNPAPATPLTGPSGVAPAVPPTVPNVGYGTSFKQEQEKLAEVKRATSDGKAMAAVVGESATLAKKTLDAKKEKSDAAKAAERGGFRQPGQDDAFKKLERDDRAMLLQLFDQMTEDARRRLARDEAQKGARPEPERDSDVLRPQPPLTAGMIPPVLPRPGEDRRPRPAEPVNAVGTPPVIPVPPLAIHLGSMRPQWVTAPDGTEMLVLVRAAKLDNKTVYQGVVLDWAKLEATLKDEVKDLFPEAKLLSVKDPSGVSPDRAMTALPVQLDPGTQPDLPPAGWTTLRLGLVLAWAAALIAFAAVGFSGWTLIDLAERRIRFVSAVTHELRTPLTSLRLYLDMLVSGMIQDEAKKQEYLNTLATESDRLHRLIDNVLDFARLEKRRKNGDVKPVKVGELLELLRQTWANRLLQDGRELIVISTLPEGREVSTDAAMVQQIVGNLIDNARKYTREAADRRIWVWAKPGVGSSVVLEVEDRGMGVPASERRSIFKPFRRGEHADSKAGGAGLGLSLARSWAEVLGGKLTYRPADGGTGACFRLELK